MEFKSGNIFIREMAFDKAGDTVEGHAHKHDHTTYVPHGGLRIDKLDRVGGEVVQSIEKRASKGHSWVLIKAGVVHRVTALPNPQIDEAMLRVALGNMGLQLEQIDMAVAAATVERGSMGHCIYSHRNAQGEIVQTYEGWHDATT